MLPLLSLLACLVPSKAWNLSGLHLPEQSILKDIAIHKSRAFLVVPRLNRQQAVTLFEAPWPEMSNATALLSPRLVKPFPNLESQIPGDCERLQSAISLAMDSKNKFLFVLDTGSRKCHAKLIQYDVWFTTFVKQKILDSISNRHLNSLTSDTTTDSLYISDAGDSSLLRISPSDLEVTRIYPRYHEYTVPLLSLAVCRGFLYMTSYDSDMLFALELTETDIHENIDLNITVQSHFLGYKMGISSGLFCDEPDGLLYYLIHDYAIVRWDINKPLVAENHQVLVQSEQVFPYVSEFFRDKPNSESIFALNSIYNQYHKYAVKLQNKRQFYSYVLN